MREGRAVKTDPPPRIYVGNGHALLVQQYCVLVDAVSFST